MCSWFLIGYVMMAYTVAVFGDVAINATCGWYKRLAYTVLKEKMSALDANEACKMRGYDRIVNSHGNGEQLIYIRHHLLQAGWSNTDHIWSDHVKLESNSSWIDMDNCKDVQQILVPESTTEFGMNCLLIDMTSDDHLVNWLIANCSEKHYYACEVKQDPFSYETFYNITISPGVESTSTKMIRNVSSCELEINKFKTFATIYSHKNKTCEGKSVRVQNLPTELRFENSTEHNTIDIKNWIIPVLITYPTDDIKVSREGFMCDDLLTTSSDITTTSSPTCECSTVCFPGNISLEQIEEIKENIRKTMTIEKKTLSSYTRQLVSASDDRTSSTAVGYVGAIIMAVCLSVSVVGDALTIYQVMMKKRNNKK